MTFNIMEAVEHVQRAVRDEGLSDDVKMLRHRLADLEPEMQKVEAEGDEISQSLAERTFRVAHEVRSLRRSPRSTQRDLEVLALIERRILAFVNP